MTSGVHCTTLSRIPVLIPRTLRFDPTLDVGTPSVWPDDTRRNIVDNQPAEQVVVTFSTNVATNEASLVAT